MEAFSQTLARGQIGESRIANWLKARGNSILPVYEKEIDTGKGPRLFTPEGQRVAPDMFVMPSMHWVEAKNKSVFTWHRKSKLWVTGIDLNHYAEYQRVAEITCRPVWLLFLHTSATPHRSDLEHGCPPVCPTGLFGGNLKQLIRQENHRHTNWGRHGMVYWAHGTLAKLAEASECEPAYQPSQAAASA